MEKLLRFLNPKTVNLDAIPSGGIPAFTTADACLALSYAQLTPVQNKLLQCFVNNNKQVEQIKIASSFIHSIYVSNKQAESNSDHEIAMFIALVELCAVPADYKPSERNRAVIGKVSRMQVQRKLGTLVTKFKECLSDEIAVIEYKIDYQLNKNH